MNYLCIILWSSWKEPTEDDFGCLSLYICRYLFTLCYIQVPRWRADGVEPGCPAVRHGVRQPALSHPVTDTRQAALLARSGPLTPAQGQWPPSPSSPSHRYSPNSSPGEVVTSHPSSRSVTSHTQLKVSDLSHPAQGQWPLIPAQGQWPLTPAQGQWPLTPAQGDIRIEFSFY